MAMRLTLPLERIDAEAKKVDMQKMFITLIIFLPLLLGWLAAKVWLCVKWLIAAVKVGWAEGTKSGSG